MDEGSTALLIVSLVVLVFLSAFFSASETAISTFNRIRLKKLQKDGNKKAGRALRLAKRYDRTITAILVGNNIVNIAAASLGTVLFTNLLGAGGTWVSTIVLTVVVLIFGEVIPKSLANEHAEKMALASGGTLSFISKLFFPVVFLLEKLKNAITRKNGAGGDLPSVTEDELKVFIEDIVDEGVLEEQESDLVQSALEFDETTVGEVLTPRVDVIAVDIEDDFETVKNLFFSERFSRMPVYEKTIDNIIGVIGQQEFTMRLLKGERFTLRDILQDTLHVPPGKIISELLRELQREKLQVAVVTDQYGGTLGIVTMEDLLEELVGEIWDEHEEVVYAVVPLGDDTFEVDGDLNIYDMFEKLGFDEDRYHFDSNTVSGWVLEEFERIPEVGDQFDFEKLTVTVKQVDEQRIVKVTVQVHRDKTEQETDPE